MITQWLLNFFRDIVVNWLSGMGTLLGGVDAHAAGAAIGGVAAQAGHFLGLFIAPGVWPAIVAAWGVWLAAWLVTGLVAIISRRGKSE